MTSDERRMVDRLRFTVAKLARAQGYDLSELVADGFLEEGDLG